MTDASVFESRRCLTCADDFAHSPQTSLAIAALINAGAINATSCLVESDCWRQEGEKLRAQADGKRLFAVGLHLNLTERLSSRHDPIPPARLALDWSASFAEELFVRFLEQWELFTSVFEAHPHFIDGHQHAHLAAAPRAALFRLIDEFAFKGWVRQCRTSSSRPCSKRLILDPLSDAFTQEAQARGVPVNPGFGGLRRFRPDEDMMSVWTRDLAGMRRGGVLMAHPGADTDGDAIGQCRKQEADALPALGDTLSELGFASDWDPRLGW